MRKLIVVMTLAVSAVMQPAAGSEEGRRRGILPYRDCAAQVGAFPIERSAVDEHLPPGFAPVAFQDFTPLLTTGLPAAPRADGTLQVTAMSCAFSGREVSVLQAWLYVDPPDEHEEPGISAYVVVPWLALSDCGQAGLLVGWGLPAVCAPISIDVGGVPGVLELGTAEADDGEFKLRLETRLPGAVRETSAEHLRFFGVNSKRDMVQVTGIVDFVVDPHTHVLIGTSKTEVESAEPPVPVPSGPGVAVHVERPHGLSWVRVGK